MPKKSRRLMNLLLVVTVIAVLPTASAFALDDTLGPVTSAVAVAPNPAPLNSTVTVTATVDDTTTGGSNIASAEFSVNGGAFAPMTAADGAFDSPTEAVTATFTVDTAGTNTVCVQGTDAVGNVGAPVCAEFTTASLYTFNGFRPSIKPEAANYARAGRTVPVKWRLTLTADGTPVSDRTVILGVFSYAVDCTSLTGDPTTAVQEKSPGKGKAGLRYLGFGRWRFNWKTPRAYAGTCRMMYVSFSDGTTSPTVLFHFRALPVPAGS